MKEIVKKLIARMVENERIWKLMNSTVIEMAQFAKGKRTASIRAPIVKSALKEIAPDLVVKNGVFKGLKYPHSAAKGSTLFPKLVGSYEKELQPLMERICSTDYRHIVDIGCAEGYYAVGLAVKIESAKVFAFDTDPEAIKLCKEMAELNGVSDRITTGAFCDADTLASLPLEGRSLIISDCEGYEKELFNPTSMKNLMHHDILIEVHDEFDLTISSYLRDQLETTHTMEQFTSVGDIQKAHYYNYPQLEGFDLETRYLLFAENRATTMEWFFATPQTRCIST